MNKYFKYIFVTLFMIFSFYYTEKIAIIAQNKTPLKKEIMSFKEENKVSSINASINGSDIIPGVNGLVVNVEKSYNNMKNYNLFNVNDIVYDEVKPIISLSDYPDKVITGGNVQKKAISIIIGFKNNNLDYLKNNNIKYTYLKNPNYCIILNEDDCLTNKNRVRPSIILNNTNFIKYIGEVKNGSILYVDDNLDQIYLDILIKHTRFYGLSILSLEDHLSENNVL